MDHLGSLLLHARICALDLPNLSFEEFYQHSHMHGLWIIEKIYSYPIESCFFVIQVLEIILRIVSNLS